MPKVVGTVGGMETGNVVGSVDPVVGWVMVEMMVEKVVNVADVVGEGVEDKKVGYGSIVICSLP